MTRQTLLPQSGLETQLLRTNYGSFKNLSEVIFNPDNQKLCHRDKQLAFTGSYPTLAQINAAYGNSASQQWLIGQLVNLSEFVGVKEKMSNGQLTMLSDIISSTYHYLKITELMLFFYNFKLGKYAEFYGTVDPLAITKSLREFMVERNVAKYNYERKMEALKEEQDKLTAITYKEYCEKNGIDPTRSIASKVLPTDGGEHPQPTFFKAKPKEDNVDEVLKSARGTVDNVYGLDKEGHAMMIESFKKRYGMLPQDYIKKHGKG